MKGDQGHGTLIALSKCCPLGKQLLDEKSICLTYTARASLNKSLKGSKWENDREALHHRKAFISNGGIRNQVFISLLCKNLLPSLSSLYFASIRRPKVGDPGSSLILTSVQLSQVFFRFQVWGRHDHGEKSLILFLVNNFHQIFIQNVLMYQSWWCCSC